MRMHVICALFLTLATTAAAQSRLFMAVDGEESAAPIAGPTTVFAKAGSTVRIGVWIDSSAATVTGYQTLMPFDATPLAGATGAVSYVDGPGFNRCTTQVIEINGTLCAPGDPAACGGNPDDCVFIATGDSIFIDQARDDYIFANAVAAGPIFTEADNLTPPAFGMIGVLADVADSVNVSDIRYLGQFDIDVSGNAGGTFEILFRTEPLSAPLTFVAVPFGSALLPLDLQPLHITITECGDGLTQGNEECDDGNTAPGDGCSPQCAFEVVVPAMTPVGMGLLCLVLLVGIAVSMKRAGLNSSH